MFNVFIIYSQTKRWGNGIELNKEAGFVVCSWIKGTGVANLGRSSFGRGGVFRQ